MRSIGLPSESHGERMGVDAIDDDGVEGGLVGGHSEHSDHAGVAMVERRHGIEQMGHQRGSSTHSIDGLVDVSGGVAHRDGNALLDEVFGGVESAFQLRSHRHHFDVRRVAVALSHRGRSLHRGSHVFGGMGARSLRRDERAFAVSTQNGAALLHRALSVGEQLQVAVVGVKGGGDDGGADGSAARRKKVAAHMGDLLLGDSGIAEVVTEGSVDLNINKTGAHDAVASINNFISIYFSRVHTTVEVALGIQNSPVTNPKVSKFNLNIIEKMKQSTFPFLKMRPFVIRMMRSFLSVWLKE